MTTPWDVLMARHALHHRRMSWSYLRDAHNPPLPRHASELKAEAKASRERAWDHLHHAMNCRKPSEARQRRMSR